MEELRDNERIRLEELRDRDRIQFEEKSIQMEEERIRIEREKFHIKSTTKDERIMSVDTITCSEHKNFFMNNSKRESLQGKRQVNSLVVES